MVIDPNSIGNTAGSGNRARVVSNDKSAAAAEPGNDKVSSSAKDSVSLSVEAQALSRAENAVAQAPEVDQARVSAVREALQSGSYQINPEAIAEKLLNDISA